jgi:hypothetical protein
VSTSLASLSRAALIGLVLCAFAPPAAADSLQPRTLAAFEAYVAEVRRGFLTAGGPVALRPGRITKVPGGLVHHWSASILIPDTDLDLVLAVAQDYDRYAGFYSPVLEARLLRREGNTFEVFARMKEDAGMLSAVVDVWSVVNYIPDLDCVRALGESRRIELLRHAGRREEERLPTGSADAYLWAANTFTRFEQRDDGVLVTLETVGLSRPFPRMLGWLIEPIARRLGRSSAERTLREFRAAVLPGPPTT